MILVIVFIHFRKLPEIELQQKHIEEHNEWDLPDNWSIPPALRANRYTCNNLLRLRQGNRNITVDYLTLGIGALIFLIDRSSSSNEYKLELARNLTLLKDILTPNDLVHVVGNIEEVDKLNGSDIRLFLSKNQFEMLRGFGISSISLSAPEILHRSLQPLIPEITREAESAGIQLTGIVPVENVVLHTKEQAQPLRMLTTQQGIKVGVLAYCALKECEIMTTDLTHQPAVFSNIVLYDIQMIRTKGARLVVVSMNWGVSTDSRYNDVLSRKLAMAGADVVVGQHPWGKLGHGLYATTLVIFASGTMLGNQDYVDYIREFLFYRIRYGRLGDMKSEYKVIDRSTYTAKSGWIEVCSDGDIYCIECLDMRIHL
ncbi:Capsular biosynthesis protein [Oopsacas minuta]|uniref:Capsular biosynthesis protein n=1 Tax=Oopsacas minuta TaxID=111878 RepID=A0AAV7KCY2_9METZ|nr:Capsular biosynthesis protein [Oopsacas minuta]